jgi:hypothetical protein
MPDHKHPGVESIVSVLKGNEAGNTNRKRYTGGIL